MSRALTLFALPFAASMAVAANEAVESAAARLDFDDRAMALTILDQHLALEPGDDEARFLFARILAWERQWSSSLEQYDRLLLTCLYSWVQI